MRLGLIDVYINFLGDPNNARASVIAANTWRGIPFVAITLLAGLQTIPQSLYEAATIDGASAWQRFRHVTFPMLTPIIAVVMRSEEHTSELQSLMRISYAVFCLQNKKY